jgi:phosphate-selective porin OprO/OprP
MKGVNGPYNALFYLKILIGLQLLLVIELTTAQTIFAEKHFDLSGKIMLDTDHYGAFFDEDAKKATTNIELRQAKITAKYRPFEDWLSKLQLKYTYENSDNHGFEVADAYIAYTGFKWADITAGKMKEPFSLERLTGSSSLTTIERSMATSAFAPGRSYGVQLGKNRKNYTWNVGIFQEETNSDSARAVTVRTTFAPVRNKNQTLHLGVSASIRDRQNQNVQAKQSAELNTADNIIRSARFDADKSLLSGIEFAWQHKSIRFQSEFFAEKIEQVMGKDWRYFGYYLQASWFVTGESALYKKGRFKSVKPTSNIGALELVTRYSELGLRDNGLGSDSSIVTVGINYHWSKNLKFMVNFLTPNISGNTLHADDSGDAISARIQLLF